MNEEQAAIWAAQQSTRYLEHIVYGDLSIPFSDVERDAAARELAERFAP